MSGRVGIFAVMGARFIGGGREQVFLMPPSVRDWVLEGHVVWTVLDAVAELDLWAFYGDYRADGHGRPAYEPSMMVALLLYAYARANRSARGIERACVEDVAYRVVAGNVAPDHFTVAEFGCRHERALGEVFFGVLGFCARAGLVSVGVVATGVSRVRQGGGCAGDAESHRVGSPRRGSRVEEGEVALGVVGWEAPAEVGG
jgi:transposase